MTTYLIKVHFLQAAEAGDLKKFEKLYLMNSSRIRYKDSRGKTGISIIKVHLDVIDYEKSLKYTSIR